MFRRKADLIILISALWLMGSPFVYGYYDISAPAGVTELYGLGIFLFAMVSLASGAQWGELGVIALTLVVAASPWLLGDVDYMSHLATNELELTSAIIFAFALLALFTTNRKHPALSRVQ